MLKALKTGSKDQTGIIYNLAQLPYYMIKHLGVDVVEHCSCVNLAVTVKYLTQLRHSLTNLPVEPFLLIFRSLFNFTLDIR